MAGNNKLLSLLYGLIALLYIIHGGINLPGKLDDWLFKNHNFILVLLATLYGGICLIYFYSDSKNHEEKDKKNKHVVKKNWFDKIFSVNTIAFLIFLIMVIYSWSVSLKKIFNHSHIRNKKIF